MIYASVCSGIEAPSAAWHGLDDATHTGPFWTPAWFSEIDPFPCAVLAARYPGVRNRGDMTKIVAQLESERVEPGSIDLLVGGTPCQSFSVAGLRKGLADPRGNLALVFLSIVDRARPRWVVWENVPGVLSVDGGRAFGAFLGGLGQLGYGFAYRVLDAQYFGVAQRRRRVFVVGYLGDPRPAAAVLFERASLSGNPPPRRKAGQRASGTLAARTRGGGGLGTDLDLDGGLIANTLHARDADHAVRRDADNLVPVSDDATEDGTGRGVPLVPVDEPTSFDWQAGGGGNDDSFRGKSRSYTVDSPGRTRALTSTKVLAVAVPDADVVAVADPEDSVGLLDPAGVADPLSASEGKTYTHEGSGNFRLHNVVPVFGMRADAGRDGKAKTPSVDAEGKARLRDPGFNVSEELAPTLDAGTPPSVGPVPLMRSGGGGASGAGIGLPGDPAMTLDTTGAGAVAVMTLAIRGRGDSHDLETREDGLANAILTPNGGRAGIGVGAVATFDPNQITHPDNRSRCEPGLSSTLPAQPNAPVAFGGGAKVRRLTPRECERLQGFPDDYTLLPYGARKKLTADGFAYLRATYPTLTAEEAYALAADGPRYKALGNSMAVTVMRWIGKRIDAVEALVAGGRR